MTQNQISKDTRLYLSLAAIPGNSGTFLFNRLFRHYGINAVYKACQVTPGHLNKALDGFRALGIAGGGVSMPFKKEAAGLVDQLDPVAEKTGVINTIVRLKSGALKGYNTDFIAAGKALPDDTSLKTVVLGAGAVARSICFVLKDKGYKKVRILSRQPKRAEDLAAHFGFAASTIEAGFHDEAPQLLINATPLGMPGKGDLELPNAWGSKVRHVIDLPIAEEDTVLLQKAAAANVLSVSGKEFARWQAMAQFEIYTGQKLDEKDIQKILKEDCK